MGMGAEAQIVSFDRLQALFIVYSPYLATALFGTISEYPACFGCSKVVTHRFKGKLCYFVFLPTQPGFISLNL